MRQSVSEGQEEGALQDVKGWSSVITERRGRAQREEDKDEGTKREEVGRRVTEHMYT